MKVISATRKLKVIGAVLALSSCTVQEKNGEISVVYPANQFAIATQAAERHCAALDRVARHLQTLPATSSATTLFVQTRTSVFECVER